MLTLLDAAVLVVYLAAVVIFGIRIAGKQTSTKDYFMGGRQMPWWAICFSIVATETSTLTIIGIPAVAYAGTLTFFQITFGYLLGRVLVSLYLLPRYYSGEVGTAYAFLGTRFGPRLQGVASVTFLVTRLLADGVRLFATAIPIKVIAASAGMDLGYPIIILGIGILTAAYTYVGGLKAVVWMDVVQMSVYLLGAILTLILVGGAVDVPIWETLKEAGKTDLFFHSFDPFVLLSQPYVTVTAVVGGAIFSMASHGTDQLIVQRLLACRNLGDARKALIGSAVFVMIQFAAFLAVGAMLWLYYDGASIADLGLSRADEVFPKFIVEGLPTGLAGLVLAGIIAAAMSTLSSSLNALASSSVLDLFTERFARLTEDRKLRVSRLLTLVWALVFVFFATLFENQQNPVVELGLSIASFTYGALLGGFLLGLWTTRPNEGDAIAAFLVSVAAMVVIIFGVWMTPDGSFVFSLFPGATEKAGLVAVAWPWYTAIGAGIALLTGSTLSLRHR